MGRTKISLIYCIKKADYYSSAFFLISLNFILITYHLIQHPIQTSPLQLPSGRIKQSFAMLDAHSSFDLDQKDRKLIQFQRMLRIVINPY